jgi:hypothetical protein
MNILAIKEIKDLEALLEGEKTSITAYAVPADAAPEDYIIFKPFVSLYYSLPSEGVAKIAHYLYTDDDGDKVTLNASKELIGLDTESLVEPTALPDDEGVYEVELTKETLEELISKNLIKGIEKTLGPDVANAVAEANVEIDPSKVLFLPEEDDHKYVSVYTFIELEKDVLDHISELAGTVTEGEREGELFLPLLTSNFGTIVEELNYDFTMHKVLHQLHKEFNVDVPSCVAFNNITRIVIGEALRGITYKDMFNAGRSNS